MALPVAPRDSGLRGFESEDMNLHKKVVQVLA